MGRLFIASAREQRRRISERTGPALRPNSKGYEEQKKEGEKKEVKEKRWRSGTRKISQERRERKAAAA